MLFGSNSHVKRSTSNTSTSSILKYRFLSPRICHLFSTYSVFFWFHPLVLHYAGFPSYLGLFVAPRADASDVSTPSHLLRHKAELRSSPRSFSKVWDRYSFASLSLLVRVHRKAIPMLKGLSIYFSVTNPLSGDCLDNPFLRISFRLFSRLPSAAPIPFKRTDSYSLLLWHSKL